MYNNQIDDELELKDEIIVRCAKCNNNRTVAYWDDELEHYIYLCDEPVICPKCLTVNRNDVTIQDNSDITNESVESVVTATVSI